VYNHLSDNLIEEIHHQQKVFKERNGDVFNLFATKQVQVLVDKLIKGSKKLGDIADVIVGMKPYQVGKGVPKQTREDVNNRIFDANKKVNKFYQPLLRGSDIDKYVIGWNGDKWIKYGDWLAEPRYSANFDNPIKIVVRQTGDTLIAALDK
jgi:adenine-specific DNA-methyltransferase